MEAEGVVTARWRSDLYTGARNGTTCFTLICKLYEPEPGRLSPVGHWPEG